MDSEAVKIIWIGTALAAGVAAVITLFAAADNIPKWSVCALVITAGASFSFSWFAFGWGARSPVRLVLCHGFTWLCVALIGAVVWPHEKSESPSSSKAEPPDVQLSITCDNVALPMAYHGDLWALNTLMPSGGLMKLMAPPGKEGLWPEKGVHGLGYRCTVKNHGTQAAFGVEISMQVSKLELIPQRGIGWRTGDATETHTTAVRIPRPLGQQGSDQFDFYICSYDPKVAFAVHVPSIGFVNSDDPKNKREVPIRVASLSGDTFTVPPKQINASVNPAPPKPFPKDPFTLVDLSPSGGTIQNNSEEQLYLIGFREMMDTGQDVSESTGIDKSIGKQEIVSFKSSLAVNMFDTLPAYSSSDWNTALSMAKSQYKRCVRVLVFASDGFQMTQMREHYSGRPFPTKDAVGIIEYRRGSETKEQRIALTAVIFVDKNCVLQELKLQ